MTTIHRSLVANALLADQRPVAAADEARAAVEAMGEAPSSADFLAGERLWSQPAAQRAEAAKVILAEAAAAAGQSLADFRRALGARLKDALREANEVPGGASIEPPRIVDAVDWQDLRRLESGDRGVERALMAAIVKMAPLSRGQVQWFRATLETNAGDLYPRDVQDRLWSFTLVADPALAALALDLASDGALDAGVMAKLVAAADTSAPLVRVDLERLGASFDLTDEAREVLQAALAERPDIPSWIASARERGMATESEIRELAWSVRERPPRASPELDALVELRMDPAVELTLAARAELDAMLRRFGYPVLEPKKGPAFATAKAIIAHNVTSPDRFFEALAAKAEVDGKLCVGVVDGGFTVDAPGVAPLLVRNPVDAPGDGLDQDGNGIIDDGVGASFFGHSSSAELETSESPHGNHVVSIALRGTDRMAAVLAATDSTHAPEGVRYVVDRGARVVNLSMGVSEPTAVAATLALIDANPDVLFVESAGNDGRIIGGGDELNDQDRPNFIRVAALDEYGALMKSSNRGPGASLAAPCRFFGAAANLQGRLDPGPPFAYGGQTSQASPNVVNLAAKCRLLAPKLSGADVKALLDRTSVRDPAWGDLVVAQGPIDPELAISVAAALGLMDRGQSLDVALAKLQISGDAASAVARVVADLRQ